MSTFYNIYCDESRHLENDGEPIMLLGAVWCPESAVRETADRIKEIKLDHGLPTDLELKWSKVSPAKYDLYRDVIDYFFDSAELHFRAVVVDKTILNHEKYEQDHDTFYFKMYFTMLKVLLAPHARFRVFLDIKDTRSAEKVRTLHEVLCNSQYDFHRSIITLVQTVRSHEVQHLQVTDLLLGALGYGVLGRTGSDAKVKLVRRVQERSGYDFKRNTLLREDKFNFLLWEPQDV